MQDIRQSVLLAEQQINQVILGKKRQIREVMLAVLAGGHILLEDIPGVGKTTLALSFSRTLALDFKRVQFTPDLMPSDLVGYSVYQRESGSFLYRKGSVFCHLLLADEINRASPKTQSALLEVMEERKVTAEGVTREVPDPFIVIATQNPAGSIGTQLLPEAEIDRFMITATLGYPDYQSELSIAEARETRSPESLRPVMTAETLLAIRQEVSRIYLKEELAQYLLNLVTATRQDANISRGGSPRATIALASMARASAWLAGRAFVVPEDIYTQFPYVISHRLILASSARIERLDRQHLVSDILHRVPMPSIGREKR